jgi:hypothetical protein
MSQHDILTLKLQMGIDPNVNIEPTLLLAMWQQLWVESSNKQGKQSITMPQESS